MDVQRDVARPHLLRHAPYWQSACPILAKEQYIKRHDSACAQLHFNICKETGVQLDKNHWYEHVPKSVEQAREAT